MNYDNCKLYGLKRKKELFYLLNINSKEFCIDSLNSYIKPRIDMDINMKPKRLIETLDKKLKGANRILYNHLTKITTPDWHFSKRGSSYLDNAKYHQNNRYMLLLDISKFFPNISRELVYKFYRETLKTSTNVAKILTDFSTVDIDRCNMSSEQKEQVEKFIRVKDIWKRNHLISGASTSGLLSFLVLTDMFFDVKSLLGSEFKMSVYVDDITISSSKPFNHIELVKRIEKILMNYGQRLSLHKVKYIDKNKYKKITGVMIGPSNEVAIPNSKQHEIIKLFSEYKNTGFCDTRLRNKLRGLVNYARYIEENAFPRIYENVK